MFCLNTHATRTLTRAVVGLVVVALGCVLPFAQSFTAVTGVVSDPTGAVIPGVEVTATNTATRASRLVITNETGTYIVSQLPPGTYDVSASLPGFRTQLMSGVSLPVGETITVNLSLEVGEITDVIDVVASAEAVNTVDAKLGVGFDSQKIIDLPLNARNIVGLLGLQPGVQISDKTCDEFSRDDGGQVNGARNDQQNIVLDGVNINRQEEGSSLEGALPTTLDSIQEFIVHTAGGGGQALRGSGGQVQLVTKSGSNDWHGSVYEFYRSTGTSARNYFASEPNRLIRHLPGGSAGGPILQDKLFFFGAYERQTDRSSILATRNVPTPEFLDGIIRYERDDGTFGVLTDGCGGQLERWTLIDCDTWNPNLVGSFFELYRPFSTNAARTTPGADAGANTLRYRFQSPFVRNRNVYVSRMDYTVNDSHALYWRRTLNDDVRTLGSESFLGFEDARERLDNSKGFAANWNWVISPAVNSNFTVGLTRESFESTGNNRSFYDVPLFSEPFQAQGAVQQAIDTWNIVQNLSWINGDHNIQVGGNFRYITNYFNSFDLVDPPQYGGEANLTGNDIGVESSPGLARALGPEEFARVQDAEAVGNAVMAATGSLSLFSEDVQFDLDGKQLAPGSPFSRKFRLQEYDFYVQDTWRATPNLTVTYGVNYSYQTPPYESNGVQLNWTQPLGERYQTQISTTKTVLELPFYTAQPAGRANDLPDYYKPDINNWVPHVSPMVIRGGYTMTYDSVGRRFARDAAESGSVGLLSQFSVPGFTYSIDGLNDLRRAPRVGPGVSLPRDFFPSLGETPDFTLPISTPGIGSISTAGIDSSIHSPKNHLINATISKELAGDWIVEASYVGRFARDLLGTVDIASPVNVKDPISGQTYYDAIKTLYETYENTGAAIADVQQIPWFENVYADVLAYVNTAPRFDSVRPEGGFTSATQGFYAVMHRTQLAGPNSAVSLVDRIVEVESRPEVGNILISPQVQFFGMFTNISRSNYNSGQFTLRKRFSDGFSLTMNYTLSKSMDITSAAESRGERANGQSGEGLANDPYNPEFNYNLSDFDRRHQFNGNFLVQLPFGQGRAFANNLPAAAEHIVSGWEFSGIVQATSGRPFNFTTGRFNHHFFGRSQPLLTGKIPFGVRKEDGRVFLIDADRDERTRIGSEEFVNVYPGSQLGRNQGRGPKFFNIDLSVTKNFSITESIRLRFRAEAFNALNHPNSAIPENGTRIDGSNFSEITETRRTERVMQFSFRLEW